MKPKKKRARIARDRPLSLDELLRTCCEPPTCSRPEAMRSFVPLDGIRLDQAAESERFKVGFTPLAAGGAGLAWAMTATHPYRFGLPLLERRIVPQGSPPRLKRATIKPTHHPWNARHFNPAVAVLRDGMVRDARGRRLIPTAIDALIFGNDDRRPYYPADYPWFCIGRIETDTGEKGSGALVGRNLVLTARHVVADASAIKFVPAFYDNQSTIGPSFYSWATSATFYEGSDLGAWDFALLRLYQPLGDHLGFFGVRTYNDDWDDLNFWTAAGYPGMPPFGGRFPSYLIGVSIDDADEDGAATEMESENQDNSKGNSGGPLWAIWPGGPYVVGVTSANEKVDYGPFGNDYQVLNAGGKAMVDLVGLSRLEIDTDIHFRPPHLDLSG